MARSRINILRVLAVPGVRGTSFDIKIRNRVRFVLFYVFVNKSMILATEKTNFVPVIKLNRQNKHRNNT